jgi:hypothetical protein
VRARSNDILTPEEILRSEFIPGYACYSAGCVMVDGYGYQNFFDGPIRVINAVNFEDHKEIVSIGLHWISDKELHDALNDPKVKKDGDERGDKIRHVAEKEKSGIYKVVKDDNAQSSSQESMRHY